MNLANQPFASNVCWQGGETGLLQESETKVMDR
jgi:hypothetical protein